MGTLWSFSEPIHLRKSNRASILYYWKIESVILTCRRGLQVRTDWVIHSIAQNPIHGEEILPVGLPDSPTPGDDVALPPKIESIRVNVGLIDPDNLDQGPQPTSWSIQRSDLRNIELSFTRPVIVPSARDLRLVNLGVDAPSEVDVEVVLRDDHLVVDGRTVTLQFASNELPDGVYQLTILSTVTDLNGNPFDGDGNGVGGDSLTVIGDEAKSTLQVGRRIQRRRRRFDLRFHNAQLLVWHVTSNRP